MPLRRRAVVALIATIALGSMRAAAAPTDQAQTAAPAVFVGGQRLPAADTVLLDGKVYIALRTAGAMLGADVAYNARKKQVTVTTLLRQSVLRIDDPRSGARIIRGTLMVPLRVLAGALGGSVSYDRRRRIVRVSTQGLAGPPSGAPTPPPPGRSSTLEGTVAGVDAASEPAQVRIESGGLYYTITVPSATPIQFRDTRGAVAGTGGIAQVKPGDTLIATLDAAGRLASIADIFAGASGTIAAISGNSMVLTNGRVVIADVASTSVDLDGNAAALSDLKPGDLVTIRSNPRTGKVREIVALEPPAGAPQGATPRAASQNGLRIDQVTDNAQSALRAGQALRVTAIGSPGAAATFDLSDVYLNNPMREIDPGRYQGSFNIDVGTNLVDAPILVRLRRGANAVVATSQDPLTVITQPPQIKDTAPADGARINTARPSIYATFVTLGGKGMDTGSIRLVVDGKDVSDQATRTAAFVSFYPAVDLPEGPTTVEVRANDVAGNALDYRWTFTIASR